MLGIFCTRWELPHGPGLASPALSNNANVAAVSPSLGAAARLAPVSAPCVMVIRCLGVVVKKTSDNEGTPET